MMCHWSVKINLGQVFLLLAVPLSLFSGVLTDEFESVLEPAGSNTKSKLGVIVPAVVSVAILLLAILAVVCEFVLSFSKKIDVAPEEKFQFVLCSEDNVKFEYEITFLVGCASKNFSLKRSYIDIEILVDEDEQMLGTTTRFECSKLSNPVCGEMCLLLGTLTEVKISAIRANHNQNHGMIFLYEYVLKDMNDKVIEVCQFNQYITNKPTIYRGDRIKHTEEHSVGMFPQVPITWSYYELAILSSFGTMLNALFIMLLEYFDLYGFNKVQDGSMLRSLEDVAVSTVLSTILMAFVCISYKYFLKRKACQVGYSVRDDDGPRWRLFSKVFLGICVILTVIMAVAVVMLGLEISLVKSLYWSAGLLIATVCMLGIWSVASQSQWFKQLFYRPVIRDDMIKASNIGSSNKHASSKGGCNSSANNVRTTYFDAHKSKTNQDNKGGQITNRVVGPKLVNPNQVSGGKIKKKQHPSSHSPIAKVQSRPKNKAPKGTATGRRSSAKIRSLKKVNTKQTLN